MATRGFFITATDTDVGKTYVTAGMACALQQLLAQQNRTTKIKVWKPVQSGAILGHPHADSYRLVHGSGLLQAESDTVSYTFQAPLAPYIAAMREQSQIDFQSLVNQHQRDIHTHRLMLIEGAGGLMVPLTKQHLIVDLAKSLGYPLIIIARPGLGTVNHSVLTILQARAHGLEVKGVILNGCMLEHQRMVDENASMIEHYGQAPVIAQLPWFQSEPSFSGDLLEKQSSHAWQSWRQQWSHIVLNHMGNWLQNEIESLP